MPAARKKEWTEERRKVRLAVVLTAPAAWTARKALYQAGLG